MNENIDWVGAGYGSSKSVAAVAVVVSTTVVVSSTVAAGIEVFSS